MPERSKGSVRLKRLDSAYVARASEAEPIEVVITEGPFVFDAKGKRYIDFVAGWCVGNLGWAREEIRSRIRRFEGPDYVVPSQLYAPWAELARRLAELAPGKLKKCYRATGGTGAVDIALQVAMAYTGRPGFVALDGSYHGNSIGTVSIASRDGREALPNRLGKCRTLSPPLDDKAVRKLETMLKRRDIAAFIMEPISCNLGVLIPDERFMREAGRLCRKYGTLLIMDEVACGFGRTGKIFASEHFDIEPDLLCLAKAITGGYAPMGATLTTDKIARAVKDKVSFYSTFGWHPLSVEAALANLDFIQNNRAALLENVDARSRDFASRLAQMNFKGGAKIRIKGLAIAVELEDEDAAEAIVERALRRGLIISNEEQALTLFPVLTIDRATVEEGLDILESCL